MIAAHARAARREVAASHSGNVSAAATRRTLRAEQRAEVAAAEWTNLLTMLAQPGRRPDAARVARMGRAAKVPAAEIARVVATLGAAS